LGCSRFFDGFEGGLQILLEHFQILMDLWLTTQRISIECWHGGTPLIIQGNLSGIVGREEHQI